MDFNTRTLGPYQIQAELGRGGTAVVYRATDTRSGKDVALKILPPQLTHDAMFLKRFIKEGKHATQLRHANIVTTFEADEIDGIYYLAMELIQGGTLAEFISQRGHLLTIDENIDILSQIAAALDFAHSQGFLHRDVKPSNILIAEDGRALLTDFGTAKQMVLENTMMTATGQRIGTPSFMSPEQITGDLTLDYRTDVYSLGVIAYQLFTGRLPFIANNQAELLHKVVYETPISPDVLNPELPSSIVANLNRALAKDRVERYESAGQFVAAIVAGQGLASKHPPKQLSANSPGVNLGKQIGRKLAIFKGVLKPVLVAVVIGCLLWAPINLRNLSATQVQTNIIAQADYLSGILMGYFDSPQTKFVWNQYGKPLMSRIDLADRPDVAIRSTLQNIWHNIVYFNDPNGWVQRTWRQWNRTKVSDLLN